MDIATKHYTKSEIENVVEKLERSLTIQFVEMKSSNHAIHRRLDNLHVPSVFPKD
jgi:heptaprenylglyceryl phosphate synthase